MNEKPKKISTDPYKGVRDFYPEDMKTQKHIFDIWRNISEKYGYEEYNASVLEPAELYKAKSGEEIVNEQTYTFIDRGDREVTLRPEMTPTVARMIASKRRELTFPVRWYSIPNLFRYEQPQRGRLREHWQLNVDLFGANSLSAEVEVINMAYDITLAYGLTPKDFEIRINNRKVMNYVTRDVFGLDEISAKKLSKLIDKKNKVDSKWFIMAVGEVFRKTEDPEASSVRFLTLLNSQNFEEFTSHLPQTEEEHEGLREIREVISKLEKIGINNVRFDQTLMRGFDYYTGIVFEIFDLNPANKRSVFGGGRYDDLLSLFGNDKISAVGFGAGDVVARDLMETYGKIDTSYNVADLAICILGDDFTTYAMELADLLRKSNIKVYMDISGKKLGDQISNAGKRNTPYILCIGEEEIKNGKLRIKSLADGNETLVDEDSIVSFFQRK
jgi:histidyl-tRNA synthetase